MTKTTRRRSATVGAAMGKITGSASAEIEAPIDEVFAVAADVEGSPRWQPEIKLAECVERDADGNQLLVRMETDAKVRRLSSTIRFDYEQPARIRWVQEEGDLKSVEGSWELEDLGAGRTRATYGLEVDLGRVLGMVIRGPVVGVLRGQLVESMPAKLKRFVEHGDG
jgi:ribosome-associated toxin RatA of RatAB toxin-antitoxin module